MSYHGQAMVRLISCSFGQLSLNGPAGYRFSRPLQTRPAPREHPAGQTVSPQSPFRGALWGLGLNTIHLYTTEAFEFQLTDF